ncbi:MAG: hypothetical protein AB1449_00485 [Chloroflexota bacterium]
MLDYLARKRWLRPHALQRVYPPASEARMLPWLAARLGNLLVGAGQWLRQAAVAGYDSTAARAGPEPALLGLPVKR